MLHWSPTLLDDCSDTEDCDRRNNFESSKYSIFNQQLDSGWMSGKHRPVLYIPLLRSDREIFDFMLEDVAMPSVSFSEEQEFEKTLQSKAYNASILTDSAEHMEIGDWEEIHTVKSVPVCALQEGSTKEEAPGKPKQQRCDVIPRKGKHGTFLLELNREQPESTSPASNDHRLVASSAYGFTADSFTASADNSTPFLNANSDLCQPSVCPTEHLSNKENLDVIEDPAEPEDPYDMHNLQDSLPKLKVTTPARLHNEVSGAFMAYSEMEASISAWQGLTNDDSLDLDSTTAVESEHDTSVCSVDSTMTVSSVESLPKVFYDPAVHSVHHLTAVSVPPLRRDLTLAAANCGRTMMSSGTSCDCDRSQLGKSKPDTRSCLKNGMVGFSVASRLRTPEPNPPWATSFSTSSKSRFSRRPEPVLSKAMVKLVFPSPSKSSSLSSFVTENQRTNGFLELYSQTYGKRLRSLKSASTTEDLDSKRRCQRSTTPQIGNFKTEPHCEHKNIENHAKTDKVRVRPSCVRSAATVPRQQTPSVPREHRLGISGATPMRSRMSVRSSNSISSHSFAHCPSRRHSLFSLEPKRHALSSCDNDHTLSQNRATCAPSHDVLTNETAGSGDLEVCCQAKKRPIVDPANFGSKRGLTLSSPLRKRNPLLQKFFDNIPVVTATNVMQYSDDQLDAVTLKNTLLNRGQSGKPSKATKTTQLTPSARPPSRLQWRTDLVTMVTEGSKVPVATHTTKARKSILNVKSCEFKSCDFNTSSATQVSKSQEL